MTTPSMGTITSLERSLQNCSLNRSSGGNGGSGMSATSEVTVNMPKPNPSLELNSQVPLPYKWEQCLDLETGELYYINWENGHKTRKDPRKTARFGGDYNSDEDDSSYDSDDDASSSSVSPPSSGNRSEGNHVLVVAGCKRCLMYFMLPKRVVDCPKCNARIVNFSR
ncbi:hypothetical protein BVC80_9101g172 [Macleaya cordata]|uniref:GIR1-like zinc ribbon domain-containing protein n=1 Tax=Macleaya cordata TaxID=56857 RepID=A0A200QGM9_MACCD|nr:hypothetical protein BVC80_9101g172 [Macleaya cordata]